MVLRPSPRATTALFTDIDNDPWIDGDDALAFLGAWNASGAGQRGF